MDVKILNSIVVFTDPAGLMCFVYRTCGTHVLCLLFLRGGYVVFIVPEGPMCCVYRPCGNDVLCLPLLYWY